MESYVLCPYFKRERKNSITCEDTIRHYPTKDDKLRFMDTYCYSSWKQCPYAALLDHIYNQDISPSKIKEQIMDNKIEQMEKEINKLMSENGKLKRKLTTYENQIRERDEVAEKNHKMYMKSLKNKDALLSAKDKQIRWLESFAAAFLVVAYGNAANRQIKMSKEKVDKLMHMYALNIQMDEDGAFVFDILKNEKGEEN